MFGWRAVIGIYDVGALWNFNSSRKRHYKANLVRVYVASASRRRPDVSSPPAPLLSKNIDGI
jgi:hypothetical protein